MIGADSKSLQHRLVGGLFTTTSVHWVSDSSKGISFFRSQLTLSQLAFFCLWETVRNYTWLFQCWTWRILVWFRGRESTTVWWFKNRQLCWLYVRVMLHFSNTSPWSSAKEKGIDSWLVPTLDLPRPYFFIYLTWDNPQTTVLNVSQRIVYFTTLWYVCLECSKVHIVDVQLYTLREEVWRILAVFEPIRQIR